MFYQNIFPELLLLFPIFMILPILVFFLVFLVSGLKKKQKMFWYLTMLFGIYVLSPIFQTGTIMNENQSLAESFFIVYQIVEISSMMLLIIVLEIFDKNTAFSGRVTFFTTFAAMAVGAIIVKPEITSNYFGVINFVSNQIFSATQIFQVTFQIVAGFWLIITLAKNRKTAISASQKKLNTGLVLGVVFTNILGTFNLLPIPIFQLLSSFPFLHVVGMVLIGIAFYQVSKNPWLLQQQRVHLLIVYLKESGINIYSHSFDSKMTTTDTTLLGGAFSAITSLFKEATKTPGTVQSIKLDGKELRLISRQLFVVALLIDYVTQGSEMALTRFADKFEKTFETELSRFSGDISVFEQADTELTKCFV